MSTLVPYLQKKITSIFPSKPGRKGSRTILISYLLLLILGIFVLSCNENRSIEVEPAAKTGKVVVDDIGKKPIKKVEPQGQTMVSSLEQRLINAGLTNIQFKIPDIQIDVRYSTKNNFLRTDLYDSLDRVYLHPDVAAKLAVAQDYLKDTLHLLSLLVFDGVRPLSVQQRIWDHLDHVPVNERTKYVSNPKNGSLHNYGAAVDLTIVDHNGVLLDMGTDYDHFGEEAFPRLESQMLAQGKLTQEQVSNRRLLRKVMRHAGFTHITTEWWHFNSLSRDSAKQVYNMIH